MSPIREWLPRERPGNFWSDSKDGHSSREKHYRSGKHRRVSKFCSITCGFILSTSQMMNCMSSRRRRLLTSWRRSTWKHGGERGEDVRHCTKSMHDGKLDCWTPTEAKPKDRLMECASHLRSQPVSGEEHASQEVGWTRSTVIRARAFLATKRALIQNSNHCASGDRRRRSRAHRLPPVRGQHRLRVSRWVQLGWHS